MRERFAFSRYFYALFAETMFHFQCPTCEKEYDVERREDAPFRPFCSQRCKFVDLGKWLDGTYAVSEPVAPGDFDETQNPESGD